MTDPNPSTFGQLAFEAYRDAIGGFNVAGKPIPAWPDLGDRVQRAWHAAADALVNDLLHPSNR